ncbi:hypothetical protein EW146_g6027 [Bondarzewia mesenterica]|uniref:Uncharacterized protein n=1 Tax=Bondarzewia mesenterica TaxID=1095465 RepID=A0A4S4LPS7_9AGAM|nr:hypothetical protein EW146_g6027 [Bondarzewia mesenterica]
MNTQSHYDTSACTVRPMLYADSRLVRYYCVKRGPARRSCKVRPTPSDTEPDENRAMLGIRAHVMIYVHSFSCCLVQWKNNAATPTKLAVIIAPFDTLTPTIPPFDPALDEEDAAEEDEDVANEGEDVANEDEDVAEEDADAERDAELCATVLVMTGTERLTLLELCLRLLSMEVVEGSEGPEMKEDVMDTVIVWEPEMDVLKLTREVEGEAEVTETECVIARMSLLKG